VRVESAEADANIPSLYEVNSLTLRFTIRPHVSIFMVQCRYLLIKGDTAAIILDGVKIVQTSVLT
jgi:hypothetical protein